MFSTSDRRNGGAMQALVAYKCHREKSSRTSHGSIYCHASDRSSECTRAAWLIRRRHCGGEIEYTVFTLTNVGVGLTRGREEELLQLKTQCLLRLEPGRE